LKAQRASDAGRRDGGDADRPGLQTAASVRPFAHRQHRAVAYGALGTPIIALSQVTGLDVRDLSAMAGRQLPLFSLIVPFWVVWAFAGFRGMLGVWPAALMAGAAFAVPNF